jgi:DNA mismatch repair protein MutL
MILRLALPYPQIAFKLTHNTRSSLTLPICTAEERLLAAWPDDFRDSRLSVDTRDAEIRMTGIIGLPELARPTAKYQFLYLNGRHIRDKFIQHALREAFRGLTEPGRYPAAILMLNIPAADVDVNVHPTKTEVRFRDGGRIHGLVLSGIREKLLGSDLTPSAVPMRVDSPTEPRADLREQLAAFFRQGPALGSGEGSTFNAQLSTSSQDERPTSNVELPTSNGGIVPDGSASSLRSSTLDVGRSTFALNDHRAPAIQLHNSYLVAQSDDGMIIIDQHALHERIMYEELLARVTRGPLESQRLLIPIVVPASSRQIALLEPIRAMLERLGIEVAPFGPDSVAVQSFPSFLEKLDPGEFVTDLLERGEQELLDLHGEELLHEILDMMSCKAAVKAGDPLTPAEIEALLARKDLVERSSNCPHGRPTTLRLSLKDLDKQFKRTGF